MKNRTALLLSSLLALADGLSGQARSRIDFAPPRWDYGMVEQGDVARIEVVAVNRGTDAVELTFVPTCTCLTVSPAKTRLGPGAAASFALSFISKDDSGITERGYIVRTDVIGEKALYYLLSGVVRVDRPKGGAAGGSASGEAGFRRLGRAGDGYGSAPAASASMDCDTTIRPAAAPARSSSGPRSPSSSGATESG